MDNSITRLRLLPVGFRYGHEVVVSNTSLSDDIAKKNHGCNCVQVQLHHKHNYNNILSFSEEQIDATNNMLNKEQTHLYIHCPFMVNLAKYRSSGMEIVQKEIELATKLSKDNCKCVLHVGKSLDDNSGSIQSLCNNLNNLSISTQQCLLLENAAGQGTELGKTWQELRHVYEGLDASRIGLCIDTQHLFAAGMCDFSSHESVVKLFDNLESIGRSPKLIHLNDSMKIYSSRVDRHDNISSGYIWQKDRESLQSLIEIAIEKNIDTVLETPREGYRQDLNIIKNIASSFV